MSCYEHHNESVQRRLQSSDFAQVGTQSGAREANVRRESATITDLELSLRHSKPVKSTQRCSSKSATTDLVPTELSFCRHPKRTAKAAAGAGAASASPAGPAGATGAAKATSAHPAPSIDAPRNQPRNGPRPYPSG